VFLNGCSVDHISRKVNTLAHKIAKLAMDVINVMALINNFPEFAPEIALNEMP